MSRLRTLATVPVCITLAIANSANASYAGIEEIGNYMQVILPAYAFGMSMNEQDWDGAKQFVYSFASMQATVYGLKAVVDEPRPNGSNKNSFPSGHTAAAFSGATFIHKRYGIKRAVIPYAMATLTGFSRIDARMHYFHDVVAGAAIGGLFTWAFVSKYDDVCISASPNHEKVNLKTTF